MILYQKGEVEKIKKNVFYWTYNLKNLSPIMITKERGQEQIHKHL